MNRREKKKKSWAKGRSKERQKKTEKDRKKERKEGRKKEKKEGRKLQTSDDIISKCIIKYLHRMLSQETPQF